MTSVTFTLTVDPYDNATYYLKVDHNSSWPLIEINNNNEFIVDGLQPGTKYNFTAWTFAYGWKSYPFTHLEASTKPDVVENIHIDDTKVTENSLTLRWDPPTIGEVDSYKVTWYLRFNNGSKTPSNNITVQDAVYTVQNMSNTDTLVVLVASQFHGQIGEEIEFDLQRDCGNPPPLRDGYFTYYEISGGNNGYGSLLSYHCNVSFRLNGSENYKKCDPYGQWVGPSLYCVTIDCGPLSNLTEGQVMYRGTTFNDQAIYTCNQGYDINGVDLRTCLRTGRWSNDVPTCQKAIPKMCNTSTDSYGMVWNTTNVGRTVIQPCDPGYEGTKSRQCNNDGIWSRPIYSCVRREIAEIQNNIDTLFQSNVTSTVVTLEVTKTLGSLSNLTSLDENKGAGSSIYDGEITAVTAVLEKVADLSSDINVTGEQSQDFINTASNILNPDNSEAYQTIEKTSGNTSTPTAGAQHVLSAMDTFAESIAKSISNTPNTTEMKGKKTIHSKSLFVTVGTSKDNSTEIRFPDVSSNGTLPKTHLYLPKNTKIGSPLYTGIYYKNLTKILSSTLLKDGKKKNQHKINSAVISLNLVGVSTTVLDNPLRIQFEHQNPNFSNPQCSFWNYNENAWDTKGCRLVSSNKSFTICECGHLTNFAILMNPWSSAMSSTEAIAINYITMVLCSVSGICLLITVILHLLFWRYVKSARAVILVHLSIALAVSYIIFLFGVDRTEDQNTCTAIAVLLQYIYLVVFFLMLAEGLEISISILLVFSKMSRFKKWLVPAAWVIPIVIVGIAMGVSKLKGFGSDMYCWLSIENGLIWSFVGPALTIALVNTILLILVIRKILSIKAFEDKPKVEKMKSSVRCLCILLPLMGCTWITGILYVNDDFVWTQYLFSICNGLQGVVIFVTHCIFNKQLKRSMVRIRKRYHDHSSSTSNKGRRMTSSSMTSGRSRSTDDMEFSSR